MTTAVGSGVTGQNSKFYIGVGPALVLADLVQGTVTIGGGKVASAVTESVRLSSTRKNYLLGITEQDERTVKCEVDAAGTEYERIVTLFKARQDVTYAMATQSVGFSKQNTGKITSVSNSEISNDGLITYEFTIRPTGDAVAFVEPVA